MSNDPCKHETNGGPEFCVRCLREVGDRRHLAISKVVQIARDELAMSFGRDGETKSDEDQTIRQLGEDAKRLKKRVDDLDQFMMDLYSAVERWRNA